MWAAREFWGESHMRIIMADNTTKMDNRDRSKVAGLQDYEVAYLAKRYKVSKEQVEALIVKHGNTRTVLEKALENLKR